MSVHEGEIVERPRIYQDYSIERKAEVLALVKANGGNVLQTSNETGIRETTIQYWIANADRYNEFRERKQADLANRFEYAAHDWLDLAESKAANAPFNHLMTGVGIAVDKMQLLRGQPTSITENIDRQELLVLISQAVSEATQE